MIPNCLLPQETAQVSGLRDPTSIYPEATTRQQDTLDSYNIMNQNKMFPIHSKGEAF